MLVQSHHRLSTALYGTNRPNLHVNCLYVPLKVSLLIELHVTPGTLFVPDSQVYPLHVSFVLQFLPLTLELFSTAVHTADQDCRPSLCSLLSLQAEDGLTGAGKPRGSPALNVSLLYVGLEELQTDEHFTTGTTPEG